jgi:hypothetical protein
MRRSAERINGDDPPPDDPAEFLKRHHPGWSLAITTIVLDGSTETATLGTGEEQNQSGALMSGSIFETCRAQRESEAARRERIARRVREVAQELGAIPGERDGEWELVCPYCGQITYISEAKATRLFPRRRGEITQQRV